MRDKLLYYAVKYSGDYFKIKNAIEIREEIHPIMYYGNFITIQDVEYPKVFKELKYPPFVLFYEGDITLLNEKMIAVVGSRKMSDLGKSYCEMFMEHVHSENIIVSGLAKGIDGYIHTLCLNKHNTVGVIGCGLDITYPKENAYLYHKLKQEYLIISEYPNGTAPFAHHFPMRNRLIAALSEKVVVIEANKRSGTLLTVNEALNLNREIYCFPHPVLPHQSSGCNILIEEGANILIDVESIKSL